MDVSSWAGYYCRRGFAYATRLHRSIQITPGTAGREALERSESFAQEKESTAMRSIFAAFLFAFCLNQASADDSPSAAQLRAAFATNWTTVTVTFVMSDSCMGPLHHGFTLTRIEGATSLSVVDISRGEVTTGKSRQLDPARLKEIIATVTGHYDAATKTIGEGEALKIRLSKLATEDERLKEIVRTSKEGSHTPASISVTFGQPIIHTKFEDELDLPASREFANFISEATK